MFKKYINDNTTYILTDIFDTFLTRKVSPEYVKMMWSQQLIKLLKLEYNAIDIYKLRNKIEVQLGIENEENGFDREITYDSIINQLYKQLNIDISFNIFLKKCKFLELNLEENVLISNDSILNEYRKFKEDGKKVICVSDMYLPKDMIIELFRRLNIIDIFDKIFISGDYLKNKKTGNLYDIVLKELNISCKDCVMIGDNIHSDYNIPLGKGINSIHMDSSKKCDFYSKFLVEHNPNMIYKNVISLSKKTNNSFEHSIFSLYSFIDKLYFSLLNEDTNEVFFLSREGEYLKKLFDCYNDKIFGKKINSHYLYVSRKATYLPSLKEIEKEDFSSLLNQYSYITILEFLKSLNFEEKEINLIIKSYKTDIKNFINKYIVSKDNEKKYQDIITNDTNKKIPNFKDSISFQVLKSNEIFKKTYEKNRIEQKNNFINYIKSKTDSKKIYVVDIGWNGSIQNNIQNILGESYSVTGYYFGLSRSNPLDKNKKYGLMFTTESRNNEFELYHQNRSLYEIILGASHGSANKYIDKNGKIEVSLFSMKEEKELFKNIISPLQDRMFKLYEQLIENLTNSYYDNIKLYKLFNKIQYNMLFKPNNKQISFFNNICHYENFGLFEFTKFKNSERLHIKKYIKENLKFFIRHKNYFDDAYWPVLKLKNLRLVIPYKLYITKQKIKLKRKKVI